MQEFTSLSFSSHHIAAGSSSGAAYIWKLSTSLVEAVPSEEKFLERWTRNAEGGGNDNGTLELGSGDSKDSLSAMTGSEDDTKASPTSMSSSMDTSATAQDPTLHQQPTRWSSSRQTTIGSGVDLLLEKYSEAEPSSKYRTNEVDAYDNDNDQFDDDDVN